MPARCVDRRVETVCQWCGIAFTTERRGKNPARRTCSSQCCVEMATANHPGNQVVEIPQAELRRRAAVIRENNIAVMQGREQQPLDW